MAGSDGPETGNRVLKILGIVCLVGVLCCGGAGLAVWNWTKQIHKELGDLRDKTSEERARWAEEKLSGLARDVVEQDDAVLIDFFTAISEGRDDDAYALTTPALQAAQTKAEFQVIAERIRSALGAYSSNLIHTANRNVGIGRPDSLRVGYRMTFGRGDAEVTATLIDTGAGVWRIEAYNVQSPLLDHPGEAVRPGPGETEVPDGELPPGRDDGPK